MISFITYFYYKSESVQKYGLICNALNNTLNTQQNHVDYGRNSEIETKKNEPSRGRLGSFTHFYL